LPTEPCDAALREAESADRIQESKEIEIARLRTELKQKDESLQAQAAALARFEETSRTKLAELENRIQDKEAQLRLFISERDDLVNRLEEAERAAKQMESEARQFAQRLEAEVASVRLEMQKREEAVAARERALTQVEVDLRANIRSLQFRLQNTEAKLLSCETELKEKEKVIQAAAVRETEIGKLIERLSSECEKLTAELCEKKLMLTQLEDKIRQANSGGQMLKKVLGIVQEERP
jgi:chromosome segregation ATPase